MATGNSICQGALIQDPNTPDCSIKAHTVRISEITTLKGLESLAPEWAELWLRCPDATPFQSPAWLISWWRHLGQGRLWVLTLRQGRHLVGLAPLFLWQTESSEREVLLVGTGITDYLDVLFLPDAKEQAALAVLHYLDAHASEWDFCDFQQLRPGSPLLTVASPEGWSTEVTVQEVCPVLDLRTSSDAPGRVVPARMVEKLRYYRRRLAKLPEVRMEPACAETFGGAFDKLLELHRARWAAQGRQGVLANTAVQRFHRDCGQQLLAVGALRLYSLYVGGRVSASLYAFSHGRRAFYYLSGFMPELAHLSPGTLLIGYAIEQAVGDGAEEFDFLRGREAYKYLWGARGRLNYRRRCLHPASPERRGRGRQAPSSRIP